MFLDCLNGQPKHPSSVILKASGRTARIQCKESASTLQSNALHWYRLKDQVFKRLMYFEAGSKKAKNDPGVPNRYAGSISGELVTLTISTLDFSDAGSYYCALWSGDNTVLTVKGNHYKNSLSSAKLLVEQQQQQGRHRHLLIAMFLSVVIISLKHFKCTKRVSCI